MISPRSEIRSATLILIVSIWIVFARLLWADFTSWDDYGTLARNPHFNPPSINTAIHYLEHAHMNLYVPVTYAVWTGVAMIAYDTQTRSLDASYFHGASLVLHTIASVIVFSLIRRVIGRVWPACFGALIFALHPVQTESLGWTSGLKDVLAWTISLSATRLAISWLDHQNSGRNTWRVVVASVLFALALLSKPSTVVTPLTFFAIAWVSRTDFNRADLKRAGMLALSWLALSAACVLWSRALQPKDTELIHPTLLQRPLIVLDTISFYITKIFWPDPLTFDYGHRPEYVLHRAPPLLQVIVPITVIGLLIALIVRRKIDWRIVAAGAAFALLGVTPVLGLVSFDMQQYSTVADHYLYGSMVGIGLIGAMIFARWKSALVIGAPVLGALAIVSFAQTNVWMNSESLFRHGLEVFPDSWPANQSLAATLIEEVNASSNLSGEKKEKMRDEAEMLARHATEIDPKFRLGWITLSNALLARGDLAGAITTVENGIKHRPDDPALLTTLSGL
ncbi:MAG TPA: hypothetical protein PK402_10800, partial [Tepidisphaeraceae bacterium]|nr:hypothetical protein [Tepidisphaeraceae bacterium]